MEKMIINHLYLKNSYQIEYKYGKDGFCEFEFEFPSENDFTYLSFYIPSYKEIKLKLEIDQFKKLEHINLIFQKSQLNSLVERLNIGYLEVENTPNQTTTPPNQP